MKNNIYIHIPFCKSKCAYCSFVSKCANADEIDRYFKALVEEIKNKKDLSLIIDTIYFGGGTPSLVPQKYIGEILSVVRKCFSVSKDAEISMESNPNSLTRQKLEAYLNFGINRLSIGVQSLDDESLKKLGRVHSARQAEEAIMLAKEVGFTNINADLLLGLEGKSCHSHLLKLVSLGVTHISAYMLMIKSGTKLFDMVKKGSYKPASDDESIEDYEAVLKRLAKLGFERYEVSNFAKPGFMCRHNTNIWQGENYIGFGISAHGYIDGVRYENRAGGVRVNKLTKKQQRDERIMLELRLTEGLDLNVFEERFGEKLLETKAKDIEFLVKNKLIKIEKGHLKVLEFGVLNSIILKLI